MADKDSSYKPKFRAGKTTEAKGFGKTTTGGKDRVKNKKTSKKQEKPTKKKTAKTANMTECPKCGVEKSAFVREYLRKSSRNTAQGANQSFGHHVSRCLGKRKHRRDDDDDGDDEEEEEEDEEDGSDKKHAGHESKPKSKSKSTKPRNGKRRVSFALASVLDTELKQVAATATVATDTSAPVSVLVPIPSESVPSEPAAADEKKQDQTEVKEAKQEEEGGEVKERPAKKAKIEDGAMHEASDKITAAVLEGLRPLFDRATEGMVQRKKKIAEEIAALQARLSKLEQADAFRQDFETTMKDNIRMMLDMGRLAATAND